MIGRQPVGQISNPACTYSFPALASVRARATHRLAPWRPLFQIALSLRYANHTIFNSSHPSRNLEIWVSPKVRAL
jgi:hypothetical protein